MKNGGKLHKKGGKKGGIIEMHNIYPCIYSINKYTYILNLYFLACILYWIFSYQESELEGVRARGGHS